LTSFNVDLTVRGNQQYSIQLYSYTAIQQCSAVSVQWSLQLLALIFVDINYSVHGLIIRLTAVLWMIVFAVPQYLVSSVIFESRLVTTDLSQR